MTTSYGRPREAGVHNAILRAAYDLLEQTGYSKLSIEGVARKAKVSKASIYRRWSTLGDLLLDSLVAQTAANLPIVPSGSLQEDLSALMTASFRRLAAPATNRLIRSLVTEAQEDEAFRERFRSTFIEARRAGVRSLLELAVSRGELPGTVNRELLIDLLYGVLWYRFLIGHAALDDACAKDLAEYVCRIAKTTPPELRPRERKPRRRR